MPLVEASKVKVFTVRAAMEVAVGRSGVGGIREKFGRSEEAVGEREAEAEPVPLPERVVHVGDHPVGDVGFRRVDEIVIAEKRPDIRVGRGIELQRFLGNRVYAGGGNAILRKRVAEIFQIFGGDGLRGVEVRVRARGERIVDRKRVAGGIDGSGPIANALGQRRDGPEIGAGDLFAHPFVRQGKIGAPRAVVNARDEDGTRDVEAELVAPEG